MTHWFRVMVGLAGATATTVLLSSCMSSPTYGTNKTAAEHLVDDLGASLSVIPDNKNDEIAYNPKPKLVVPKNTAGLPAPQDNIKETAGAAWVESPEETRKRLVEEADAAAAAGREYRSPLLVTGPDGRNLSAEEKQQAYREARKLQQGAYLDKRRFLSDPPAEYRTVQDVDLTDLGEPEKKKEAERKKKAKAAKQSGGQWWNIFN